MKKAVITARTPAIEELFTNSENCLLCEIASSKDLAKKIKQLYLSPDLRKKIAKNGYKIYNTHLTPQKIGENILEIIEELNYS